MNFYEDPTPTPSVTVGNTGSYQPQLQQPTKSHILQDQYITGLENRLRVLWDKYYGDRKHYMDRIKHLEDIINRAHLAFFSDSSDRKASAAMQRILDEEVRKEEDKP